MIMKRFALILTVVLAFPCMASAAVDLRVKLGNAAGAEKIEFGGITTDGDGRSSSNVQLEAVLSPASDATVGFVMGLGIFHRKHSGKIDDPVIPTTMDYEVTGISVAPGFRIKATDNFNFELKLELGYGGSGKLTLESPNMTWNDTDTGTYTSASLIAGWYYAFSKPGLQLGLEIGAQSFQGDFKIWNNFSGWEDGTVKGTDAIANLVLGMRF
jgi:hypothetical protein